MQSLTLEYGQPEPQTSLVESPVRERETIQPAISRQNISAMDIMGLSWIFLEEDDY